MGKQIQEEVQQQGYKAYARHGEYASIDTSTKVLRRMEEIKIIVSEYDSNDVSNMDTTGVFYRLEPNRTSAMMILSGKKKQNEQITVALTTNAIGTICLPPLIIN